jgi:hypothetical protein
MSEDRRKHRRFAFPMEGSWSGASGANRCRIADISLGGCFVQTLSPPRPFEKTTVTVTDKNGRALELPGQVVYPERGLGFAVEFIDVPAEAAARLAELIEDLARRPTGD